jgi:hypothetical protein
MQESSCEGIRIGLIVEHGSGQVHVYVVGLTWVSLCFNCPPGTCMYSILCMQIKHDIPILFWI